MKIKSSVLSVVCTLFVAGCSNLPVDGANIEKTIVFYNANILTLDPKSPTADTMLVAADKISKIGKLSELDVDISKYQSVDLKGATILPGFIDSHVHVRELGMDKIKADLVGVKNVQDIVERLKSHAPDPIPGEWIIGQGWDEGYFASIGYPDRAQLDAAFANNPIHLESLHGFGGFYNGAALKIAGVDANTAAPDVGDILRRPDGEPTGVMLTLAQDLVNRHIPPPDAARVQKAIKSGLMEMASAGVTSVHEAGMSGDDVDAFKALRARNELPIRVYGMLNGNDQELMSAWFESGPLDDAEDFLDIRGIKVFYDGSLGSRTALMKAPYSDEPNNARPTERISPAAVKSLADRAVRSGFQMAVHAIGDEGNDRTLSIYERALEAAPTLDHRWRIEHAQVVLPDFFDRMSELGAIASMQSSHAVGDSAWAEARVGEDRIKHAYAWQRILGAGGHLVINSDLPGEPWKPTQTLYFAVTRRHLDGEEKSGWYEDQALSVDQALTAMTPESAFAAFQENMLGSLETGKWADFVVLDRDPHTISSDDLKNIQVTSTWVAGKQVYSASSGD